jgi:iron(III) transport system substrate-binding protein
MIFRLAALALFAFAVPGSAQEKGWEKQWNELVAAAKKEARVVVMGSADPVLRKELPAKFREKYGISLEYLGGRGGDNYARLMMERRAGVYTTDAIMSGMSNMVDYYTLKALDPLLPELILPEVTDGRKWKNGKPWFMDPEGKYILRLYNYIFTGMLYLNVQHAKPEEFHTIKELINPKWAGKISVMDPTASGPGEVEAALFYVNFGEDFVKRLYVGQRPAITRDKRQIVDWLARGTYPVSLSAPTEFVIDMKKEGLPVDMVRPPDIPKSVVAGNGLLALVNKAPHPNAARLFANWLASREGMELLGRARAKPTTRNDIDESYASPWEVPQPNESYFDTYEWKFTLDMREHIGKRVKEILKR